MMQKRQIPFMEGKSVNLRMLRQSDLALTLAWRNKPEIRRWFFYSEIISSEQHIAWFEQYRHKPDDYVFIIEDRVENAGSVGQVSLYNLDFERGTAEFGRLMIGEDAARGKGFAAEATRLILKLAFETFKLRQVYLSVYKDNKPAVAIYRKCGFEVDNLVDDMYRMSIQNPDSIP